MIDRSQFLEELRRNPALMHRIAVITAGEVSGSAPISKQILQAETIFNRAMARGITLEQATREVGKGNPDGKQGGYYPRSTFEGGEKSLARAGGDARFYERVLKPVLAGSDEGTKVLGFAPTGNASEGANRFASRRAAAGIYSQYKWHPDGKEMYVQEARSGDNNSLIDKMRKGGDTPIAGVNDPPPRPPGSVPNVAGVSAPQGPPGPQASGQPDILAPVGDPGDPRRAALYGPGPGQPARSAQPARPGGLGGAMRSIFGGGGTGSTGYAPPGRSTYLDPNTGHTILNPGGSGEEAMGITRDLGARPSQAAAPRGTSAPNRTTAPAPTPLPQPRPNIAPEGMQPPLTTTNTAVPDIVAPQLKTDPRRLSPFEINPNMQVPPPESAAVASLGVQRETSMARPGEPVSMASLLGLTAAGSAPPVGPMPPAPGVSQSPFFNPNPTSSTPPPDLTGLKPAPVSDMGSARPPFAIPPNLTTQLNPLDEMAFRSFVSQNKVPFNVNAKGPTDYDMRGFFQRSQQGDPMAKSGPAADGRIHYPDIWKTPAHPTGSNESMYSTSPDAPRWSGDKLAGPGGRLVNPPPSAFDRALTPPDISRAPEEARSLAVPNAKAWQVPPPSSADASAAFSGGGAGLNLSPYLPPKTVDQQLGVTPIGGRRDYTAGDLPPPPASYPEDYADSMPGARGTDPLHDTAMANRLHGLQNEMEERLRENRRPDYTLGPDPINRPRGGVPVLDPFTNKPIGVDEFNQPRGQPIDYRPAPPPQPQMMPVRQEMAQANLSPFEQWPPPWWDVGGGGFGGGGFDFGAYG